MDLDEAKSKVGPGWGVLIEQYFKWISYLDAGKPEVFDVGNRIGMLKIRAKTTHSVIQDILNRLSWSIERDSAKVCEICGNKGFRRKALPNSPNRCQQHYVELMNQQG